MSKITKSNEYISFCSSIQRKIIVTEDKAEKNWRIFDSGPKAVSSPIIFLTPVSGTADIFYNQMLTLTSLGYRCISIEYPVFWSLKEWCDGFLKFIDHLELTSVHIFGASLGGFLAQKFAEAHPYRVASLILCNSFTDTSVFNQNDSTKAFWLMPSILLKKMLMGNFDRGLVDPSTADSIDFMVEKLDSLAQKEVASRMTLNCENSYIEPHKINENEDLKITIIDVCDRSALSNRVKDDICKCYPNAKLAILKSGGNFPYVSRSDEVNLYIKIHLRPFLGQNCSPSTEDYLKNKNEK